MNIENSLITQSRRPPMDRISDVKDYSSAIASLANWDEVAILFDEGPSAILALLIEGSELQAVFRFSLSANESVHALTLFLKGNRVLTVRSWQGKTVSQEQLQSLRKIDEIWNDAREQSTELNISDALEFFAQIELATRGKGRGGKFSAETRHQILLESHGRCMFEGCGTDLTIDPITGKKGNYAYLAHNVASSEQGPRGIIYLSECCWIALV